MPDLMTNEFDDIIRALQQERPEIDPAFARELDARAAAGFAKPRRRWRLSLPYIAVPATGLAALVIAIGVASSGGGGDDLSVGAGGGTAAPEPQVAQSADEAAPSSGVTSSAAKAAPDEAFRGRVQERSASLTLVAPSKDVAAVGDKIIGVADEVGGFVESSSVRATDGTDGGGDFQLRVPVGRLDDALGRLSRLAHVAERSQGSQDITAARNHARDLLQEAQAERRSLLEQLEKATTTAEIESLKAQLNDVRNRIDAYAASLARVNRRARFAAVSVSLMTDAQHTVVPVDDGKWTPGDALDDAGRVLEVAAGVLVIAGSVLLPLVALALLAGLALRVAGRRGRNRVLDAV